MKVALLFSGGKDSTLAGYLAKKEKNKIACLITLISENPDSYMFHTPSISQAKKQADVMKMPIIFQKTAGKKEAELKDLEKAIKKAKRKYKIKGIVTGALKSNYQASRIKKICEKLKLICISPLWQKSQFKVLNDLIKYKFDVVIVGVAAYPLNEQWIGRKIDKQFIKEVEGLNKKYEINPAGEGGEFETFVLNCPLFKKKLKIYSIETIGEKNSWRAEIKVR